MLGLVAMELSRWSVMRICARQIETAASGLHLRFKRLLTETDRKPSPTVKGLLKGNFERNRGKYDRQTD